VIIVLPGIAAVVLEPNLTTPDQAYPTMMRLLPTGLLGLVFAALIAAIVASTASKINSIATIFTLDIYAKFKGVQSRAEDASGTVEHEKRLVLVGRIAATVAIVIAILTARPILGSIEQAFQYIQEFSGFVTPGITVIFLLGLFWPRATEAGALVGAITSVALSVLFWLPTQYGGWEALNTIAWMNRMGIVFLIALALAVIVSLLKPTPAANNMITMQGVSFRTAASFNVAAVIIIAILIALYTIWW
jgi:SSS family solute:Na+ symporter